MTDATQERRIAAALAQIEQGSLVGISGLYDLVSGSMYGLATAFTRDPDDAAAATVAAFVEIWATASQRPADPDGGTRWVLDVTCRCAKERATVDRSDRDSSPSQPTRRHSAVPVRDPATSAVVLTSEHGMPSRQS